jgi:hypothetical protein
MIEGAELHLIPGMGHKSDYVARDLVMAAIAKLTGTPLDLAALVRQTERRIARGSPNDVPLPSVGSA